MAIAHVCVRCGWDLARVRPQREPHYGLNIVRCPKCAGVSVRRRHPIHARWRKFRRLDFALTLIFLRLVGVVALTFLCTFACILAIVLVSEWQVNRRSMPADAAWFATILYVTVPLVLGAFLTAAFAHIDRWKMWLGWLAWITFILFMVSLHGPLDDQFDPRSGLLDEPRGALWFIVYGLYFIVLPGMLAMIAMLILALPGVLMGKVILRLRDAMISAKWRWKRKRLRLAGAANV